MEKRIDCWMEWRRKFKYFVACTWARGGNFLVRLPVIFNALICRGVGRSKHAINLEPGGRGDALKSGNKTSPPSGSVKWWRRGEPRARFRACPLTGPLNRSTYGHLPPSTILMISQNSRPVWKLLRPGPRCPPFTTPCPLPLAAARYLQWRGVALSNASFKRIFFWLKSNYRSRNLGEKYILECREWLFSIIEKCIKNVHIITWCATAFSYFHMLYLQAKKIKTRFLSGSKGEAIRRTPWGWLG